MLFVVEGVDGAGKTASSKMLKEWLQVFLPNTEIVSCRAPDGPIRDVLLNRPEGTFIDYDTEVMLFAMCHRWLLLNKVLPALDRGAVVVLDRFTDSTIAYQGGGRRLGTIEVANLLHEHVFAPFGGTIVPDYRIYIEADEAIREARLAERAASTGLDHMDKQGIEFRRRNQDAMNSQASFYEQHPHHQFGKTEVVRVQNNGTVEELEGYFEKFARMVAPLIEHRQTDISHEAVSRRIETKERLERFRAQV